VLQRSNCKHQDSSSAAAGRVSKNTMGNAPCTGGMCGESGSSRMIDSRPQGISVAPPAKAPSTNRHPAPGALVHPGQVDGGARAAGEGVGRRWAHDPPQERRRDIFESKKEASPEVPTERLHLKLQCKAEEVAVEVGETWTQTPSAPEHAEDGHAHAHTIKHTHTQTSPMTRPRENVVKQGEGCEAILVQRVNLERKMVSTSPCEQDRAEKDKMQESEGEPERERQRQQNSEEEKEAERQRDEQRERVRKLEEELMEAKARERDLEKARLDRGGASDFDKMQDERATVQGSPMAAKTDSMALERNGALLVSQKIEKEWAKESARQAGNGREREMAVVQERVHGEWMILGETPRGMDVTGTLSETNKPRPKSSASPVLVLSPRSSLASNTGGVQKTPKSVLKTESKSTAAPLTYSPRSGNLPQGHTVNFGRDEDVNAAGNTITAGKKTIVREIPTAKLISWSLYKPDLPPTVVATDSLVVSGMNPGGRVASSSPEARRLSGADTPLNKHRDVRLQVCLVCKKCTNATRSNPVDIIFRFARSKKHCRQGPKTNYSRKDSFVSLSSDQESSPSSTIYDKIHLFKEQAPQDPHPAPRRHQHPAGMKGDVLFSVRAGTLERQTSPRVSQPYGSGPGEGSRSLSAHVFNLVSYSRANMCMTMLVHNDR
jgi:hypothetical protein